MKIDVCHVIFETIQTARMKIWINLELVWIDSKSLVTQLTDDWYNSSMNRLIDIIRGVRGAIRFGSVDF